MRRRHHLLLTLLVILAALGCGSPASPNAETLAATDTDTPADETAPPADVPTAEDAAEAQDADEGEEAAPESDEQAEREKKPRPTHEHPAFEERVTERNDMVRWQIAKRGVKDAEVLTALRTVPRHAFVPRSESKRAYYDSPLPIGLGQTISQPYIVAYMTEKLQLDEEDIVLEIGTGSGYQAAVCAEIAAEVYTIEILPRLGEDAAERLTELGYPNVETKVADGYYGWEEHGPYDAIIVTAAAPEVPRPLVQQLKPGGRMIIPVGGAYATQYLILITKTEEGELRSRSLLPVRFVPLTRQE